MSSLPTVRDAWVTSSLVLKLALAAALSCGVVALVPHTVASGGDVPPVRLLLVTATMIGVICSVLLFWGLRSDLGLPAKAAVYAVVFNVLVIVVKLALAPHGFLRGQPAAGHRCHLRHDRQQLHGDARVGMLGAAREGELDLGWRHLLAALALASSYVSATALNDLADEEIDKVNHPRDAGRPLVEGWAARRDLRILCRLAAALALCLAVPLGSTAVALVGVAKPTLLLRFGKTATCVVSLGGLVAADCVLGFALDPALTLLLQPFVLAIGCMLWRLWRADEPRAEQVAIGIGARMGNGLLLTLLAWLVVDGTGASARESLVASTAVVAAFFLSFVSLAARPDEVLVGYKG